MMMLRGRSSAATRSRQLASSCGTGVSCQVLIESGRASDTLRSITGPLKYAAFCYRDIVRQVLYS